MKVLCVSFKVCVFCVVTPIFGDTPRIQRCDSLVVCVFCCVHPPKKMVSIKGYRCATFLFEEKKHEFSSTVPFWLK